MPYVWDEPTKPPRLTVIAPGGLSSVYDMTILKEGNNQPFNMEEVGIDLTQN